MWFEPSEHSTLRPQENESCIAVFCLSVGFTLIILTFCVTFNSSTPRQVQCDPWPDRWPQGGWILLYSGATGLV
jgi:hypothetical protein